MSAGISPTTQHDGNCDRRPLHDQSANADRTQVIAQSGAEPLRPHPRSTPLDAEFRTAPHISQRRIREPAESELQSLSYGPSARA